MLSNITVDGRASVQTILLGQPQFRPILASKDAEQLRQRVLASYHLGPMTEQETQGYIEHRLRTVGWQADPTFEPEAFTAIHRCTGGIPRRINTLVSRVLLYGALEEAHAITPAMVETTNEELDRDLGAELTVTAGAFGKTGKDDSDSILRRIETLEQSAFRQEQALRRVIDLLESGRAAQP